MESILPYSESEMHPEQVLLGQLFYHSENTFPTPLSVMQIIRDNQITEDLFSAETYRQIFAAIKQIIRNGMIADYSAISKKNLDRNFLPMFKNIGDKQDLLNEIYNHAAYEHGYNLNGVGNAITAIVKYLRVEKQKKERLKIISEFKSNVLAAPEKHNELFAKMQKELSELPETEEEKFKTSIDYIDEIYKDIEDAQSGKVSFVETGYAELDKLVGGWQKSLNIIGAMPGVGKSGLIAGTLWHLAKQGIKCGVFSLEDNPKWLFNRIISAESRVSQIQMRKKLDSNQMQQIENAQERYKKYINNLVLDGRCSLTASEIVQRAKEMIEQDKCKIIFVDHLGEVKLEGQYKDRHDLDLSFALMQLRDIAKMYEVPVVIVTHLKRREGLLQSDTPRLTDFANAAGIERQARLALGLSRDVSNSMQRNELVVHVLKNTNGPAGDSINLGFDLTSAMVINL